VALIFTDRSCGGSLSFRGENPMTVWGGQNAFSRGLRGAVKHQKVDENRCGKESSNAGIKTGAGARAKLLM
jgi:hypothetical protein